MPDVFDFAAIAARQREIRLADTGVQAASGEELDRIGAAYDCLRGSSSDDYYRGRIVDEMKKRWYGKSD